MTTRQRLWWGFTVLFGAAVAASAYVLFVPKIGHATRAEVEAVLPASLKVEDIPDPAGEARYRSLMELFKRLDKLPSKDSPDYAKAIDKMEGTLAEADRQLDQGELRVPMRSESLARTDVQAIRDAANRMAVASKAASERSDRSACGKWTILGLRFANALRSAGGSVADQFAAITAEQAAFRAAYEADLGGLNASSVAKLIGLLPSSDGTAPEMAAAVRREFRWNWLPVLINPQDHLDALARYSFGRSYDSGDGSPKLAGTLDPVASARLSGAVYDAVISDLVRPFPLAKRAEQLLVEQAGKWLPTDRGSGWAENAAYRGVMNAGHNTLGRQQAANSGITALREVTAKRAAARNVLRAAILLRRGETPTIPDPFGTGPLLIDIKRKMVWSVGRNGKNDGGVFGPNASIDSLDIGYAY